MIAAFAFSVEMNTGIIIETDLMEAVYESAG